MFFYVSKALGFFAVPSNLIIVVGIVGALLTRTRFARAGGWLAAASLVALAICGFSPLGNALIVPLENRFPVWDQSRGAPHGIVVLGGGISPAVSALRNDVVLNEAGDRMTAAVMLARRYPNARILFSGGDATGLYQGTEAEIALRLFEATGIERSRVIAEGKSRNTIENALFSKQLAQPQQGELWLLVTSAYHLPRAIGAFRKIGFPVEAYPADWRTAGPLALMLPFRSLSDGLQRTDTAMREWVGLVAYWLAGHTSELFPGPDGRQRCDRNSANNCRP